MAAFSGLRFQYLLRRYPRLVLGVLQKQTGVWRC
jgi:hypothetical protein